MLGWRGGDRGAGCSWFVRDHSLGSVRLNDGKHEMKTSLYVYFRELSKLRMQFGVPMMKWYTFIMLSPSWSCSLYQLTIMNANNHFATRNQTILFFQPRFGYIDIIGKKSRWLHHDKGLLHKTYNKKCFVGDLPSKCGRPWIFLFFSREEI